MLIINLWTIDNNEWKQLIIGNFLKYVYTKLIFHKYEFYFQKFSENWTFNTFKSRWSHSLSHLIPLRQFRLHTKSWSWKLLGKLDLASPGCDDDDEKLDVILATGEGCSAIASYGSITRFKVFFKNKTTIFLDLRCILRTA